MKYRKGDRVKFLNESGGGVISKIVSPNLVHVTIEDGFDIPVLPSELIKIEDKPVAGRSFFNESHETESMASYIPPQAAEEPEDDRRTPLYYGKNAAAPGIYLAFSPQNQKFLITGDICIYIMNNTPYDIIYNLYTREGDQYNNRDYDTVFAEQKILVDIIPRDDLSKVLEGFVQVMFQKEVLDEIPLPVHAGYKVQGSKFYQENSFKKNGMLNEQAIVIAVAEMNSVEKVNDRKAIKKLEDKYKAKEQKITKPQSLIDRHKIGEREAEVDLHISALKEDFKELSSDEILRYQISYFETSLESAITHQYQKVIFIHGIGNGTLKSTLRKKVKEEYPDFIVRNAAFTQYGNGAIEVLISEE